MSLDPRQICSTLYLQDCFVWCFIFLIQADIISEQEDKIYRKQSNFFLNRYTDFSYGCIAVTSWIVHSVLSGCQKAFWKMKKFTNLRRSQQGSLKGSS